MTKFDKEELEEFQKESDKAEKEDEVDKITDAEQVTRQSS